jgi:hypothetical protein
VRGHIPIWEFALVSDAKRLLKSTSKPVQIPIKTSTLIGPSDSSCMGIPLGLATLPLRLMPFNLRYQNQFDPMLMASWALLMLSESP